jgi:hypothetical protein
MKNHRKGGKENARKREAILEAALEVLTRKGFWTLQFRRSPRRPVYPKPQFTSISKTKRTSSFPPRKRNKKDLTEFANDTAELIVNAVKTPSPQEVYFINSPIHLGEKGREMSKGSDRNNSESS